MFGPASLGAALAIKELIAGRQAARARSLLGTPAEEDVGGKIYMARDGVFNDLDVVLAWHPGEQTKPTTCRARRWSMSRVEFHGKAAHAASDPWNGRSAVDALELFTARRQPHARAREAEVRMHYTIATGGDVPNVVPEYAQGVAVGAGLGSAAKSKRCSRACASSQKARR